MLPVVLVTFASFVFIFVLLLLLSLLNGEALAFCSLVEIITNSSMLGMGLMDVVVLSSPELNRVVF